jgi:hypothetical protein
MLAFITWITVNNKALKFEYSKVIIPGGDKYFVNVYEQQNLVTSFELKEKRHGNWKIIVPAPEWLLEIQDAISHAIEENQTD